MIQYGEADGRRSAWRQGQARARTISTRDRHGRRHKRAQMLTPCLPPPSLSPVSYPPLPSLYHPSPTWMKQQDKVMKEHARKMKQVDIQRRISFSNEVNASRYSCHALLPKLQTLGGLLPQ